MSSLNKVLLMGRVTRDPELRHTPKGRPVAELSLAINRVWTEEGPKREEVTFVDVILWNRVAEIAQQYLRKGSPVFIEGRLELDTWEDKKSGQKRSRLRVVGENLQLIGDRSDIRSPSPSQAAPSREAPATPTRRAAPDPHLNVDQGAPAATWPSASVPHLDIEEPL